MEQPFKINVIKGATGDIFQFHGNIDAYADQYFEELINQISVQRIIMDFSCTGRINSMGIALLLRSIKRIKVEKQAEVSIKGLNQINNMLFKMTGIFQLATE